MLLFRIVHFLIGGALAGGGGFLAWIERARVESLLPPDPSAPPWLLVVGVGGLSVGVVFLASAVAPRPKRAARLAAQAARRREMLAAADAFYAERARAADRDWRSGDLPAPPAPQVDPPTTSDSGLAVGPAPTPASTGVPPPAQAPETAPVWRPQPPDPPSPPEPVKPAPLKPVATSIPPVQHGSPFPSMATLTPIPRATDLPPPVVFPSPSSTAVGAAEGSLPDPFSEIRGAIADGRLAEADRLLTLHRERAQGAALAELTGLAGDHAAAAGRTSNAKWLWRLALKRFDEVNAMDTPAARAVSERLRLADQ